MMETKKAIAFLITASLAGNSLAQSPAVYAIKEKVAAKATPFKLGEVKLLESPFRHAMVKNSEWLLSLEPDRFLHNFRLNAGLEPKGKRYGGWEARGVAGHSLGHYLSAISMQYAATADDRFKQKADYIVKEIAECQAARKTGYVGGIPGEDKIWNEVAAGNIRSQGFDLNGGWVPWYTVHKVLAGLLDVYHLTGNMQAKDITVKVCDWIDTKFATLTEADWQKMLDCEHGGMNETLAEVYALTGNKKYLTLSHKFHHKEILDPLAQRKDVIHGLHANTQIPKIIGTARRYELTGNAADYNTSQFFWNTVVNNYSYAVGGNSDHERFSPTPGNLVGFLSTNTTETCNTYNMLKLTEYLYELEPRASYMDYIERAMYNHILASQNPTDGMVLYYLPLASGTEKRWGTPTESWWCCSGTGMENHTKYARDIYYKGTGGALYVNLFIPSELTWKEKGLGLKMETAYPESDVINLTFNNISGAAIPLMIRRPWWATLGAEVMVNGKAMNVASKPGEYFTLSRNWKKGDKVTLRFPMKLYTQALPGSATQKAILYGPLVLAGRMGNEPVPPHKVPVFVAAPADLSQWIKKGDGNRFTASYGATKLTLSPLYKIYDERYGVYWNFFSQEEWKAEEAKFEAARKAEQELDARTLDLMRIGEMQPERDHNFEGERTNTGEVDGVRWRDANNGGWFQFTMETKGETAAVLQCAYFGGDGAGREFDIKVDGQIIATEKLKQRLNTRFYTVDYAIPEALLKGKQSITVRFQALEGKTAGGLFGCRLLRK